MMQNPACMPDYSQKNPYAAALSDEILRKSQRALYRDGVFETPDIIKKQLTQQSFALWKYPATTDENIWKEAWCLSTIWDTVLFDQKDVNLINFSNLLPAKGKGGASLYIKDMNLHDVSSSVPLMAAFREIEAILGQKLCFEQDDDC